MNAFQPQVLSPVQREVLAQLGPFAESHGFYLAGGTAVALRLGHRRSEDFDWFAAAPGTLPEHLPPDLEEAGIQASTGELARGTYHGRFKGVNITFLRYRYPMLEEPQLWPEYGCRVAMLSDLACMKLSAVSQRSVRKDFVDLYAILTCGITLAQLLESYQRKYKVSDVIPVLYGLTYFDEPDRSPMPDMLIPADWDRIKSALRKWAKEMLK